MLPTNKTFWLIVAVLLAVATSSMLLAGQTLPREAALMAGIFVLAALLWMTEALPLFATALLVIGLQTVLLANPGGWPGLGFESGPAPGFQQIFAVAVDPVLALFFGGLVLAQVATREKVDSTLAGMLLAPVGNRPAWILLTLMLLTAFFSMWMSNTATAAMMVALAISITSQWPIDEPFRKGLLLSVPFAANIGGLGTPVSSPPNAIAIGFLERAGHAIGFLEWMLVAIPLMLALLLVTWWLLWRRFSPSQAVLPLPATSQPFTRRGWLVVAIMAATILLWMSERWHGLPAAAVALLLVAALTVAGLIQRDDIDRLEWNVLILIAGGISLGAGMQSTGLAQVVAGWLPAPEQAGGLWLLIVLVAITMVFSNFMSNTATANLMLPLGIAATTAPDGEHLSVVQVAMSIALTASVSMALPVSTPPNSIAYSYGIVTKADMIRVGATVGLVAAMLVVGLGSVTLHVCGLGN